MEKETLNIDFKITNLDTNEHVDLCDIRLLVNSLEYTQRYDTSFVAYSNSARGLHSRQFVPSTLVFKFKIGKDKLKEFQKIYENHIDLLFTLEKNGVINEIYVKTNNFKVMRVYATDYFDVELVVDTLTNWLSPKNFSLNTTTGNLIDEQYPYEYEFTYGDTTATVGEGSLQINNETNSVAFFELTATNATNPKWIINNQFGSNTINQAEFNHTSTNIVVNSFPLFLKAIDKNSGIDISNTANITTVPFYLNYCYFEKGQNTINFSGIEILKLRVFFEQKIPEVLGL